MSDHSQDFRLRGHWVERRLRNGMLIPQWEPPVPRIQDRILESIFYLYRSMSAAEEGEQKGGCGVFMTFPFERGTQNHLYAITNRHLIDSGACTLRINSTDGRCIPVDSDDRKWFRHPDGDDLAILLIDFPFKFECVTFPYNLATFVTREKIQQEDIGPGDDVLTVGRFVGHEGKNRNAPVVRFGNISQMPVETIRQDDGHFQESYLVEVRSLGGYSGSPAYVFIPPFAFRPPQSPGPILKYTLKSEPKGPWFLGLNWGHLNDWKPVCDEKGTPVRSGMMVAQNSGMMGIVPAWKLIEMLEHPKMVAERKAREEVVLGKGPPIATRDHADDHRVPKSSANPDHKADFRRLVTVASKTKPQAD